MRFGLLYCLVSLILGPLDLVVETSLFLRDECIRILGKAMLLLCNCLFDLLLSQSLQEIREFIFCVTLLSTSVEGKVFGLGAGKDTAAADKDFI